MSSLTSQTNPPLLTLRFVDMVSSFRSISARLTFTFGCSTRKPSMTFPLDPSVLLCTNLAKAIISSGVMSTITFPRCDVEDESDNFFSVAESLLGSGLGFLGSSGGNASKQKSANAGRSVLPTWEESRSAASRGPTPSTSSCTSSGHLSLAAATLSSEEAPQAPPTCGMPPISGAITHTVLCFAALPLFPASLPPSVPFTSSCIFLLLSAFVSSSSSSSSKPRSSSCANHPSW
mmetsp:Transcript_16024/g.46093  ORF Transcript_16024/g.46093 Transcript_16024/m.46093 type:complete len:233 (-) Transcript_16024:3958-4656(-)